MQTEDPDNINEDDGSELPAILTPKDLINFLDHYIIFLGRKVQIVSIESTHINCCYHTYLAPITFKQLAKYKVETVDGVKLYGNKIS